MYTNIYNNHYYSKILQKIMKLTHVKNDITHIIFSNPYEYHIYHLIVSIPN